MKGQQNSDKKYRELMEQASDGIFIADLEGRYIDVNSAGAKMLGYTPAEIIGKTIMDLISKDDVKRLWKERKYMLKGNVRVSEWQLKRKDGRYIPVEVSAKILPDGRWQGFVRDITERKLHEEAILLLNKKIIDILNSISDGFFSLDTKWQFTYFNKAAEKLLPYKGTAVTGKKYLEGIPGASWNRHREILSESNGRSRRFNF